MRINNPKSFAGFALNDSVAENNYKLATIGQVTNALHKIDQKFEMLLRGDDNGVTAGVGGLVNKQGYAWLNHEGKVDPSLLPALAITNTHVIPQNELELEVDAPTNTVYYLIDKWMRDHEATLSFQQGDIVIVTPHQTVGSMTTEEAVTNESEGVTTSLSGEAKNVNPAYSGTYILTHIRDASDTADTATYKYTFAKMAYTDSNIVSINGCAPGNTTGQMQLFLKDVLKMGAYKKLIEVPEGEDAATVAATELEDVIYRLAKTKIQGVDEEWRFAFIDDSADALTKVVPYAKYAELKDEETARALNDAQLSSMISALKATVNENHEFTLNTFGTRKSYDDVTKRELSGTVFEQLHALRADADYNADILALTRSNTNNLINQLQGSITSLYSHLEGRAVAVIEKQITWGGSETSIVDQPLTTAGLPIIYTDTTQTAGDASSSDLLNVQSYPLPNNLGTVKGTIKWTYEYKSPTVGASEFPPGVKYENAKGDAASYERIIAVFDQNGEKVDADIEVKKDDNGKLVQKIIVETDNIGTDESGQYKNSLVGLTWTLLISKTIIGIENNVPVAVEVGSNYVEKQLNRGNLH